MLVISYGGATQLQPTTHRGGYMAYISLSDATTTSLKVRVAGLDDAYNNTTRRVDWTAKIGSTTYASTYQYLANQIVVGNIITLSPLSAGTEYKITAVISNINGGSYPNVTLIDYFSTIGAGDPLEPPNFYLYDIGTNYITIKMYSTGYPSYVEYGCWLDGNHKADITNGATYTFTGLNPGTQYQVQMDSYNTNTSEASALSSSKYYTTDSIQLATPTLDVSYTQKTHNTLSVRANAVTGADYYYFELWNSTQTTRIAYQNTTSRDAYFSGLTAGTQYYIRVKVTATGYTDSAWSSWYGATTTIAVGWNWQHSTMPWQPIALTRAEWLAFQNKINEIRVGRGYTSYTFTTSTAEINAGLPIKAAHFNQAIAAINTMLSSVDDMTSKIPGDPITSSFMIELKDKLNSCIV